MKKIKFRAWDKITKQIFEVKQIDFNAIERNVYGWITYKELLGQVEESLSFRSFDDVELMQYTGLKDKHGQEIYEGDIVKAETIMESFPVWIGEVMRECDYIGIDENEGAEWVIVDRKLGSYIGFYPGQKQKREVIGNIFENKELLK